MGPKQVLSGWDGGELVNNENKRVLHIPQRYRTGASPSNCLVSYLGHSSEIQLVYTTGDWTEIITSSTFYKVTVIKK